MINLSYQITIPYLQIGEYRVETPVGLSELLEKSWTVKVENDDIDTFASSYHRTVFRNSEGRLVTRYKKSK